MNSFLDPIIILESISRGRQLKEKKPLNLSIQGIHEPILAKIQGVDFVRAFRRFIDSQVVASPGAIQRKCQSCSRNKSLIEMNSK